MTAKTVVKVPEPKTRQLCGWPIRPAQKESNSRFSEQPVILLIEEKPDRVFLIRFTTDGRCVGDSWHMTLDGAREQASLEFNDPLLDWAPVPIEVEDIVSFGLSQRDE